MRNSSARKNTFNDNMKHIRSFHPNMKHIRSFHPNSITHFYSSSVMQSRLGLNGNIKKIHNIKINHNGKKDSYYRESVYDKNRNKEHIIKQQGNPNLLKKFSSTYKQKQTLMDNSHKSNKPYELYEPYKSNKPYELYKSNKSNKSNKPYELYKPYKSHKSHKLYKRYKLLE